jgi:MFS family permease
MVEAAPAGLFRRTFASLWERNFRLFFFGQLISNSGNWLTIVAVTLLVLHRTHSGAAVGLLSACQFGPILVLSAWAGVVADRWDKRRLLYVTQSLEMSQSAVLAVLAFLPHTPVIAFYLTMLAGGVMLAFDNPARRSFVNEMVGPDNVANAVTLYSGMVNLSRIFGPTLAAFLVATAGYGWTFTVDAASYVVVITALVRMRADELRPAEPTPRARGQIRAGLRYLAGIPELWITFVMLLVIGTVSYNFTVVFPLFVERGLHGTDADFGLVYATFSAGSVIGTLAVARRTRISLRTIVLGAAVFGLTELALWRVPGLGLAFPVVAAVGGASVSYMTATTALAQIRSQRNMIGRVLAIQTVLLIGTTPVGGPVLGVLADSAGPRSPLLAGAVAAGAAAAFGLVMGRRTGSLTAGGPPPRTG